MLYHIIEITLGSIMSLCTTFGLCAHWQALTPAGRVVAGAFVALSLTITAIAVADARDGQEGGRP